MMVVKLPRHSPRLPRKLSHLLAMADRKQWGEGRQGDLGGGRAHGERAGSWGRLNRKPSQLLHGSAVRHDLQIGRSVGLFQATHDRLGYGSQQVLVPRVQANKASQRMSRRSCFGIPKAAQPGQNGPMASPPSQRAHGSEPRIDAIVAGIAAAIPEAQVRLFGSRARGTAHADSDLDLLITVPDPWLATHDRVRVLGSLWRQWSSSQLPLDLLLYSESEIDQRQQYRGAVTTQSYLEGIVLYG